VFDQIEMPTSAWLRQRFSSETIDYTEPILGIHLRIHPRVFIPDPVVIDLFLGAYLSPEGILLNDIIDKSFIEPCTGSGILGLTVATLGARHVLSTDVDQSSAQCARFNVERLALRQRVVVEIADGIPSGGTYDILLSNPPWYDREGDQERSPIFRRCLEDPGRQLLGRILDESARRGTFVAYIFFGVDDPFTTAGPSQEVQRFSRWRLDRRWGGSRGVRLQRLALHRG
jgi:hypothetical protein